MDNVDKALLVELSNNCRISFSELANLKNISIEEVGDRIKKLFTNRIILKFTVVPSPRLFNAFDAIILFRSMDHPLNTDRITLLGINSCVEYISVGNHTEGFAFLHCRSVGELDDVIEYFHHINPTFDYLVGFIIEPLSSDEEELPHRDLLAFEKVDWLMLSHLREQGRLDLSELSVRTKISVTQLKERLEFLRLNNLIEETIQLNLARSPRELFTLFKLELTLFTTPLYEELTRQLKSFQNFWQSYCWKVVDQNVLLLGFLCSSYTDVEKIQNWLSDTPGLKSIEKVIGGHNYYFLDFRDEILEEKRSHGWFSPEQWVKDKHT